MSKKIIIPVVLLGIAGGGCMFYANETQNKMIETNLNQLQADVKAQGGSLEYHDFKNNILSKDVTINGLVIKSAQLPLSFNVESLTIDKRSFETTDKGDKPFVKFDVKNLTTSERPPFLPKPILMNLSYQYDYNNNNGDLVTEFNLNLKDYGNLNYQTNLKDSQSLWSQKSVDQNKLNSKEDWKKFLGNTKINSSTLEYKDAGLIPFLVNVFSNHNSNAFKDNIISDISKSTIDNKLKDTLTAFVKEPKSIKISLKPKEATEIFSLITKIDDSKSKNQLVDLFNALNGELIVNDNPKTSFFAKNTKEIKK